MKISVCLVIRNEEILLPRCLESIKDLGDEIILVHDGVCDDRSLQIAKKYGARTFVRPLIGEAEYHRPYSYNQATGDWILQIDADEYIDKKNHGKIKKLIGKKDIDAYSFYWPYSYNTMYMETGPFSKTFKPCLFRKSKLYMIGISHEYPRTYGHLQKISSIQLEHKPQYDNFSTPAFKTKWEVWAKLQAKQIVNLDQAPRFNIEINSDNKLYKYYYQMQILPIISGIIDSIKFISIYLCRGLLISSFGSWKIAYLELIYLWYVRINIWRISNDKRT